MSICQCLRVVERSCKSQFIWRGTARVPAAVYEFLLRDMAIRPLIDGATELDPDEPHVTVHTHSSSLVFNRCDRNRTLW